MIVLKTNASGQEAIFLNHQEIINKSYNESIENSQKYKIQPQLFAFRPKLQNNSAANNNMKRKRKSCLNISPETTELKQTCTVLISLLKEKIHNFEHNRHCPPISRVWEEPITFPQFRGVNERNDFQIFTFQNREYLIPPHCKFFNHDLIKELPGSLDKYDFIVIDPPWKNKYIRRIKKAKQELGYKMLENDLLSDINLSSLIHCNSIVAIWCTNSKQHQQKMLEEFFPRWDLKLIHKIIWLKLNTDGNLISEINDEGKKQPYEVLFVACHCETTRAFKEIKNLDYIMSVPSVIHSHKPPISELFHNILPTNPTCLELFARYLQPNFTSIGLEVLKLMDTRLYTSSL